MRRTGVASARARVARQPRWSTARLDEIGTMRAPEWWREWADDPDTAAAGASARALRDHRLWRRRVRGGGGKRARRPPRGELLRRPRGALPHRPRSRTLLRRRRGARTRRGGTSL